MCVGSTNLKVPVPACSHLLSVERRSFCILATLPSAKNSYWSSKYSSWVTFLLGGFSSDVCHFPSNLVSGRETAEHAATQITAASGTLSFKLLIWQSSSISLYCWYSPGSFSQFSTVFTSKTLLPYSNFQEG